MGNLRAGPSGRTVAGVSATDRYGRYIDWSVDAFGRVRTGNLVTIFESKQIDLEQSALLMQNVTNDGGSATYQQSRSSTLLTVTSAVNSRALRQSRRYLNYQPGKSQKIDITFRIGSLGPSTIARAGYFDDSNGIFFSLNYQTPYVVIRSNVSGSVVENAIPQSEWNLDKLDGTGLSGITLDPYSVQIFSTYFEWLGVGGVFCGFVIDNHFVPCHFFAHSNYTSSVFMRTSNLPVRWELVNSSSSSASELEAICADVGSEGGVDEFGFVRASYLTSTVTTGNGEVRELLSLRLKSSTTDDTGSVLTRATVRPEGFSVLNTSNDSGNIIVGFNPTFTGAGTWADPGSSAVQVSKTGRVVTNVGTVIDSQIFSAQVRSAENAFDRFLALSAQYDGTPDVLSLMMVNTSGSSTVSLASLRWREL